MSEEVSQQPALSIEDDISRLLKRLDGESNAADQRLLNAQAALKAAMDEVKAAESACGKAKRLYASMSAAYATAISQVDTPEPEVASQEAEPEPSPKPKPGSKPVAARPQPAKPVASARPSAKREQKETMTVPERVAAVMGDGVWDGATLEPELLKNGIVLKTSNIRNYISNIFGSKVRVQGADGKDLRTEDGELVEVRMFTSVERSRFRVATDEEKLREARKILASDEIIISTTGGRTPADGQTPADVMFAEQGIDISPVVNSTNSTAEY